MVLDVNGRPGEPGFYQRYCVQCCVASHGALCGKRRNIGSAQTRHFGDKEPLAYLGAWLASGASFPDRDSHILFKPRQMEVEAYMRKMRWL